MPYIGIDPGFGGGIATISYDEVVAAPMPIVQDKKRRYIDMRQVAELLAQAKINSMNDTLVVIESVAAMPKQGVASTFRFGEGFGMLQGIVAGLGMPMILVKPTEWKKEVLSGTDKDKAAAINFCQNLWPDVDLSPGQKRKPHDGMADALCLAYYGAQKHGRI